MSTVAPNFPLPSPSTFRPSRWALIRAWLPTIVWIGVIAFESTSTFTSSNTQNWLFAFLRHINWWLAAHAAILNAVGRKVGHFVGYGALGCFAFFGWTEFLAYRKERERASVEKPIQMAREWQMRAAALAVLVTFVVASLDEFHQSFVPGRGAAFHDVVLDTFGAVIAQVLIAKFWKPKMNTGLRTKSMLDRASGDLAPEA